MDGEGPGPLMGGLHCMYPNKYESIHQNEMSQATQSKRKGRPRTLLLLLKSLVGLRVRVELKNDCVVEGIVQEVVHDMECVARNAR